MANGEPLTAAQVKSMLSILPNTWAGRRDKAFFTLLYRCGLRSNEARMLDLDDIDMTTPSAFVRIRYPKGKERGASPRSVGLDLGTQSVLMRWFDERGTEPGPLFLTKTGQRIRTNHYRRKLKRVAQKAGVVRRVHPHALRHTFARELNEEGISMRLIQMALGHRSLATTEKYLQGLGDPEVIALADVRGDW